jgi:mono/diheme cytochrome c family protein
MQPAPTLRRAAVLAATWIALSSPARAAEAPVADPDAGRSRFNNACAKCHGANGATPIPVHDLRRLRERHGAQWVEVARSTTLAGRYEAGMPVFRHVLDEQALANVIAWLGSIQR